MATLSQKHNVLKFAAHYMLTPFDSFVRWPVITTREDGRIIKIEYFPSGMKEAPGIRFFSGILLPAFVDVLEDNVNPVELADKRVLNRHFADGTIALGVKDPPSDLLCRDRLPLILPRKSDPDECDSHFQIPADASLTVLQRTRGASKALEGASLANVLTRFSMDSARAIGLSNAGCLAPGFAPGLLLLQNTDLEKLRMTPAASVKWLVIPKPGILVSP